MGIPSHKLEHWSIGALLHLSISQFPIHLRNCKICIVARKIHTVRTHDYSYASLMNPTLTLLVIINILVVSLVVIIHNSALWNLARLLPRIPIGHFKLVIGVIGALIAHAIEIWVFAVAYYVLCRDGSYGTIEGVTDLTLLDCVYFSFSTYSTLGYGDLIPHGAIRYTTGIESLTGLVMITWTASFLFIEMKRFWKIDGDAL